MMRVGIYARVSTTDKGQDPGLQLGALREYAQARGWAIYQEYIDQSVSGTKERRPALDQLIRERVKAGVARARIRGKQLGRPQKVFHRDHVEQLRAEGLSFRQIGKCLGISAALAFQVWRSNGNGLAFRNPQGNHRPEEAIDKTFSGT